MATPLRKRILTAWGADDAPRFAPRTQEQYLRVLDQLLSDHPDVDAKSLGATADTWLSTKALSESSRKAYLAALRQCCHALKVAPPTARTPRVPDRLPRPLADEQLLPLLRWAWHQSQDAPDDPRPSLVYLTFHGLRNSEACALTREAITVHRPDELSVRVCGKYQVEGEVPLNTEASTVLVRYLLTRAEVGDDAATRAALRTVLKEDGPCFPGWERRRLARAFAALREQLDLPATVQPHALRHTFITRLHDADQDVLTIRDLARHRDLRSTQRYTAVSTRKKASAVAVLPTVG